MAKKLLYGLRWNETTDPLHIEMEMCRAGGTVTRKDGSLAGNGLEFHWKRAQSMLWPDRPDSDARKKWHRWNELQADCYVKYRTIVVIGPASSGKTCSAATDVLFDYYLYPSCTSVIICSTTRERLEDRVWGEIKKYHKAAKHLYPWLPGHLIEGRLRLVTDDRSVAEEGRDFRNGIIGVPCKRGENFVGIGDFAGIKNKRVRLVGDECFPAGTLVDTEHGPRPIEAIKPGDRVFSATGLNKVQATVTRHSIELVRVLMRNGKAVKCTPDHPFFTQFGWVKACELNQGCYILSAYEAMRLLRQGNSTDRESKVLPGVRPSHCDLSSLRQGVSVEKALPRSISENLRLVLQHEIDAPSHRQNGIDCKDSSWPEKVLGAASRFLGGSRQAQHRVTLEQGSQREALVDNESQRHKTTSAWREWLRTNQGRATVDKLDTWGYLELSNSDRDEKWQRLSHMLQSRCGCPGYQASDRGGRGYTQQSDSQGKGFEEGHVPVGSWVDRVEVSESRDTWHRYNENQSGHIVYNLQVEGHPSYSVNGLLVHNCSLLPRAFVDAISNLDKNEDFKCVGMGNPKETTDALGIIAEPAAELGGWDSGIDQAPKTKTWPIRRPEGICIQLVGSDSPNLDGKLGIPIITQEQIDRDVAFYGKDSVWFTMMNEGRMPRGQGSHRVLTRQMCLKFHALEEVIWRDSRIKKIAFMDAGYGGDRCVFGELRFGEISEKDVTEVATLGAIATDAPPFKPNRQVVSIVDTLIVPVTNEKTSDIPEDQIVAFVSNQLENRGIPMTDFFYEPGQRTKLSLAFMRITGQIGNPIDCLGKPTDRPLARGVDILCKDYYSKFISEIWYSMRHAVEASQIRGLPESAMWELCSREWGYVGANKIEVEPKVKMKEKTGRSPDEADAICIGLEGARQRGFQIEKVGTMVQPKATNRNSDAWKRNLADKSRKAWHSGDLDYAA